MSRSLKRLKNDAIYLLVVTLLWLLRWLPHRAALAVGRGLGGLAWALAGRERRRARANLELAGVGGSPRRQARLVRRMFEQLGRSAMECVVMDRLRPRLGTSLSPVRYEPGAKEALERALARGKGVVYVTAHLDNWELMAAEVARLAPVSVLYKPSYDPRLTRIIEKFRSNNGVKGIPVTHSGHLRQVLAALARGEIVGILLDQPVPTGCQVSFFHRPAWTSQLAARLHRTTGASLVFGCLRREGPSAHLLSIKPVFPKEGSTVAEVTQGVTGAVELAVRCNPDQWLWSLDRWRSTESSLLSTQVPTNIPVSNA